MGATKRKPAEASVELPRKKVKSPVASTSVRSTRLLAEPEFIRGGASTLTPIERRKIAAKAAQDVLFEQNGSSRPQGDDTDDEDMADAPQEKAVTKPKRRKQERKSLQSTTSSQIPSIIAPEGLTTKKLTPGAKVLGQICAIHKNELVLSLPNNLTGHVPINAISDTIDQRLEALGDTLPDLERENQKEIDLNSLFHLGQFLRSTVISAEGSEASEKVQRRRIQLSINPRLANQGLLQSEIAVNTVLQTEVLSIEDHGIIVALRIDDSDVRGFLPRRELPTSDLQSFYSGSVLLCLVTGLGANGKVTKLSAIPHRIGDIEDNVCLSNAPGIGALLPGTAIEFIVSSTSSAGLLGKAFGIADVMADVVQSGAWSQKEDFTAKFPVGSRCKGRLIWTSSTDDRTQIGISLLNHVLHLDSPAIDAETKSFPHLDLQIGQVIEEASVIAVEPKFGLFMGIGSDKGPAFVHISRVSDGKIDTLSEQSGKYMLGTVHRCRLIGFNCMDGLYLASLAPKTLDLPFLRIEELTEGDVVRGTIESLIEAPDGSKGALVKLTDTISGFAPSLHLSDVALTHPERKFRPGTAVTARVLSTDFEKNSLKLTLKKSLVNSDAPVWKSFASLALGPKAPGTIIKFVSAGAIVQFFGRLQGLLPLSQMSEAYIANAEQHFRLGQVVIVRILTMNPLENRLILTCREPEDFGPEKQQALNDVLLGSRVSGKVVEKTRNEIILELDKSKLKAMLACEHLLDGPEIAISEAAKRLHVGQHIKKLLALKKDYSNGRLEVTQNPNLIKASASSKLPSRFDDLALGLSVTGYVNNTTDLGVFVSFLGGLTALLPKFNMSQPMRDSPSFGIRRNQSITAFISDLDAKSCRVTLSQTKPEGDSLRDGSRPVLNAIDGVSKALSDFSIGRKTRAKITGIKDTQLNVQLADGIRGRIDASKAFNSWEDIQDKKHPLAQFQVGQDLPVRILGTHDSKTHRFLPISHVGKANVYELSARSKDFDGMNEEDLSLEKIHIGSLWLCFVNNVAENAIFVNLAPSVRGRISLLDVTDDVTILSDLEWNFPIGSAIQATVTRVDLASQRLDLSRRSDTSGLPLSLSRLSAGSLVPAMVTKVLSESIIVQLSENIFAPIHLTDLADDFSMASPESFQRGQVIRVCVVSINAETGTIRLSTRPSKTLSSSSPVTDKEIIDVESVKVNDVLRGFVKSITPSGIFVALGPQINALVKVSDVSDAFIKDWSAGYELNQLVNGKIVAVQPQLKRIQMSLKESALNKEFKPLLTFHDVHVGELITGKVRKVEDYGVFIVINDSTNVSGLCHRTELADEKVGRVGALYEEGDLVQAVILDVDLERRRISFSMKTSRVESARSEAINAQDDYSDGSNDGVPLPEESFRVNDSYDSGLENGSERVHSGPQQGRQVAGSENFITYNGPGLSGGFKWSAPQMHNDRQSEDDSDSDTSPKFLTKAKRNKNEDAIDRTADLDMNGPQTGADFERLLLGQPNSSSLWAQYMAFEVEQGEIEKARAVAERAVRSINHQTRETEVDAMNAWVTYLNLEILYGNEASLSKVFDRACEYNDPEKVHGNLAEVYIKSGNVTKADSLLERMTKKYSSSARVWKKYAEFLFDVQGSPDRARELLPRALQSLSTFEHNDITLEFALLEFHCKNGQTERGRTIFEGLISNSSRSRQLQLWHILLDLEMKASEPDYVRMLFERVTSSRLKASKAHKFFQKWLKYEEKLGDQGGRERVEAKAAEYVKKRRASGETA